MVGRAWQLLKWLFEKPERSIEERGAPRPRRVRVGSVEPENLTFLKLKAAIVQRRFEAARALLQEISGDPVRDERAKGEAARLCEAVADDLREWDRDGSIWLYEQALLYFQEIASWSPSGAEDVRRLTAATRVDEKLKQLRAADAI